MSNTADMGAGSLRQAIIDANLNLGLDTITFAVASGPITIAPLTPLDEITDPVIINGTSQPGFVGSPIVEIDGTLAGLGASGLRVKASTTTVRGLIINRFNNDGIQIYGPDNNVLIAGNWIGVDLNGTLKSANNTGIALFDNVGAPQNVTIGGTTAADANVISGNNGQGIYVGSGIVGLTIAGNYIGTDKTGTAKIANNANGIFVDDGNTGVTVGGATAASRNIICGNGDQGIQVDATAASVTVQNNFLGIDATGLAKIGNTGSGLRLSGTSSAIVSQNTVGGNGGDGIALDGAKLTLITGNVSGVGTDGKTLLGNSFSGVAMFNNAAGNTIGGPALADRNILSGNGTGIYCGGSGSTLNSFVNNFIGVDATGLAIASNTFRGLWLNDSGTNAVTDNVIAGNKGDAIAIDGAAGNTNQIKGNKIGVATDGKTVIANTGAGVLLVGGANNNTIGGNTAADANVIGGNQGNGVAFYNAGTAGNLLIGNYIGVSADLTTAIGNTGPGVVAGDGSAKNTIGGVSVGDANVIANNTGAGVLVWDNVNGALIRGNKIYSNGGLGIDLTAAPAGAADGVTANDVLDPDLGGNTLLNFPVITSIANGLSTSASGTYNGLASTMLELDFYASATADPSGFGEGARYIGSISITTDGSGNAPFSTIGLGATVAGEFITATASDLAANVTSEFSNAKGSAVAPTVSTVVPNGGGAQRSNVFSIVITFSESVTFSGPVVNAFTLTRANAPLTATEQPGVNGKVNIVAAPVTGPTSTVTLTFATSGAEPIFGVNNEYPTPPNSFVGYSLPDGTYNLAIDGTQVSGVGGNLASYSQTGSSGSGDKLYRLFGDLNGDGAVSNSDFNAFKVAFAGGVNVAFDYNNDGDVANNDFNQLKTRFGSSMP